MVNDTCLETVNWWGKENMQPFLTSLTVTYLLAELDHLHQWPVVLVGFVGLFITAGGFLLIHLYE